MQATFPDQGKSIQGISKLRRMPEWVCGIMSKRIYDINCVKSLE